MDGILSFKDQQTGTVAEEVVNKFITRFGVLLLIHPDQGRNFESELFSQTCNLLGIHKTGTTALHPQSDKMIDKSQQNWDENLP